MSELLSILEHKKVSHFFNFDMMRENENFSRIWRSFIRFSSPRSLSLISNVSSIKINFLTLPHMLLKKSSLHELQAKWFMIEKRKRENIFLLSFSSSSSSSRVYMMMMWNYIGRWRKKERKNTFTCIESKG